MKPLLWIPALAALLALAVSAPAAIITNVVSDPNDDAFGLTVTADNWTNNSVACGYLSGYAAPYLIGAFRFTGLPLIATTPLAGYALPRQVFSSRKRAGYRESCNSGNQPVRPVAADFLWNKY